VFARLGTQSVPKVLKLNVVYDTDKLATVKHYLDKLQID